jgi:nigerose phosphorylase
MDWTITETNLLSPQDIDRQGNKLLIGNGYIGYRGTLEEFTVDQKTATIVSGLYDKVGDGWREPIDLPNGCFVQVNYKGEGLHALRSKVIDHSQSLDMHAAIHTRRTTFEAADGTRISVQAQRFASLARTHLICMQFSVSADRDCELSILTGIDDQVWDINGPHLRNLTASEQDGVISVSAVTHENSVQVAVSEWLEVPTGAKITTLTDASEKARNLREIRVLHAKEGFTFCKFIACATQIDTQDPLESSRQLLKQAAVVGYNTLLGEHTALWLERWENCDIQIEGDEAAELALRFSMYHLLAIIPAHTEKASIPARGMSGQMYKGAIFWDTEIFMLPFFVHVFPAMARNLLLYRYHTLDGARGKAREYGYRGAFYAWESQDTGEDACTLFNLTDVFTNRPLRTYFRDKQVHISADVAYAFWQYFMITGDASIWRDGGAEVVFECARFFLSYTYYSPDRQRYEILDVTGPDEYHERVNNNAFTNRMVAHTLEVCLRVAEDLKQNSPTYFKELVSSLDFEADLDLIAAIARDLFLPDSVSPGGLIPQFDGYFNMENIPIKTLLERQLHPNEYFGGGNGIATTTQIIKQADVVLMLYLFGECFSPETLAANWEYYEPRTEHGSSLSACSYSLIAARIGKVEWAYRFFMKTATIDLTGEGKQYVGTLYIGGTHPAGNGGAWMAAVFGLCGIHCTDEAISIQPHLPSQWKKVTLPIIFRGQSLRITLTQESITVKAVNSLRTPIFIFVDGTSYLLPSTGSIVIPAAYAAKKDAFHYAPKPLVHG